MKDDVCGQFCTPEPPLEVQMDNATPWSNPEFWAAINAPTVKSKQDKLDIVLRFMQSRGCFQSDNEESRKAKQKLRGKG